MYDMEERRQKLIDYVSGIDDETAKKRLEGKWSILEVLEHLSLTEAFCTDHIKQTLEKETGEPARKKKPIQLTLDRTNKVKAPEAQTPIGRFRTMDEALKHLAESRNRLNNVLQPFEQTVFEQRSLKHPVFGTMSIAQWLEFIGLHEMRHLEQITELEQQINIEMTTE